jgi:hypothetical protein
MGKLDYPAIKFQDGNIFSITAYSESIGALNKLTTN